MVGPGEVDDELQPEIEEECATKYGEIIKVIIFEVTIYNIIPKSCLKMYDTINRNGVLRHRL